MNHLTESQLYEYLDNIPPEEFRQQAEAHLAACDQCRAQRDEMQSLFATLAELSEIPLARDLTPDILTHISPPALWRQPAFVAQSILTALLLAISMPMLNALRIQVEIWRTTFTLPMIQLPSWAEIITQLTPLLVWKRPFTLNLPKIAFRLPTTPTPLLNADANILIMLVVAAGILWMVGNITLLRSRPEVEK